MHQLFHTCIIIYTQILMAGKEFGELNLWRSNNEIKRNILLSSPLSFQIQLSNTCDCAFLSLYVIPAEAGI